MNHCNHRHSQQAKEADKLELKSIEFGWVLCASPRELLTLGGKMASKALIGFIRGTG